MGEGRIDDPNAGWKGKGLWATSSTRTVFHNEGGKANKPQIVKFQLRPIRWRGERTATAWLDMHRPALRPRRRALRFEAADAVSGAQAAGRASPLREPT